MRKEHPRVKLRGRKSDCNRRRFRACDLFLWVEVVSRTVCLSMFWPHILWVFRYSHTADKARIHIGYTKKTWLDTCHREDMQLQQADFWFEYNPRHTERLLVLSITKHRCRNHAQNRLVGHWLQCKETVLYQPRKKENIVKRNFTVSRPNEVWVSDVTLFRYNKTPFSIWVIIDLFARKVVDWLVWSVKRVWRGDKC